MKWLILILTLIAVIGLYIFAVWQLGLEPIWQTKGEPENKFLGPKEPPSVKGPSGLPPNK